MKARTRKTLAITGGILFVFVAAFVMIADHLFVGDIAVMLTPAPVQTELRA